MSLVFGRILFLLGLIVGIRSAVRILAKAFRAGLPWGVLSLLVPGVVLVFIALHWEETRRDLVVGLLAILGLLGLRLLS